ncbi:MAG: peroxiredoxin [Burkholderiaceae bacterium]|nr:peroxiredoxin [Burkholderiaceae bacterium]
MKPTSAALLATCVLAATTPNPAHAELKPGDPAPDFTAPAALGGQPFSFSLADALKKGPVVLYFYPKAFTSGCTIEANRFAEAHDDYARLGATVIGVSGDDIETLQRFSVTECRNKFAVAADADGRIMKSYDAAMPFSTSYARRISYVISPEGRIAYAYSSMSPEQHVPNTLDAVRRWAAARNGSSR